MLPQFFAAWCRVLPLIVASGAWLHSREEDVQGVTNKLGSNLSVRVEGIRQVWGDTRCTDGVGTLAGRIGTKGGHEPLTCPLFRGSCRSFLHPVKWYPRVSHLGEALPDPSHLDPIALI